MSTVSEDGGDYDTIGIPYARAIIDREGYGVETILRVAFRESEFLHSAGSGNVQAIENILKDTASMDEHDRTHYLAGAVAGMAMVNHEIAYSVAEQLLYADALLIRLTSWLRKRRYAMSTVSEDGGDYDTIGIKT